jgi:SsrA-binding protein
MKRVAENRKARFDIAVEDTFEAGIILTGDEIKAIRADRVQLTGAYVKLLQGKNLLPRPVLIGMHLATAKDPQRVRDLLLKAKELRQISEALKQKGKAAVPLDVHFRHGWAKVTIGIGSGRKKYDKRALLKERDLDRQQRATLKRG